MDCARFIILSEVVTKLHFSSQETSTLISTVSQGIGIADFHAHRASDATHDYAALSSSLHLKQVAITKVALSSWMHEDIPAALSSHVHIVCTSTEAAPARCFHGGIMCQKPDCTCKNATKMHSQGRTRHHIDSHWSHTLPELLDVIAQPLTCIQWTNRT